MIQENLIWPITIASISVICTLILRPALIRLLDRTTKISKDGLIAEGSEKNQEQAEVKFPLTFEEVMSLPVSISIQNREQIIKKELHDINIQDQSKTISLLIRVISNLRVESEFKIISNIIFGSQLELLVNISGTQSGVQLPFAVSIFESAKSIYPERHAERTFDQWIGFLMSHALISIEKENIDITQYGKDFLKYLIDSKEAHRRAG